MRPLTLTLDRFIGIRAGLNRETLTLDFEALAGEAALVALVGPNGAGKSTILDNLHPYRIQPSRAGGYSPGSFSYYDQVYGPEASKELVWEHAGQRYRSVLAFKSSARTKKTDAYLFRWVEGAWQPASAPDGTVSDGKTDTYDRVLESILGTPQMFFTSAFSCQGRRSLSSYANGEIKGLLSELLGLEPLREIGDRAKEVGVGLRMRLEALRDGLARAHEIDAELSVSRDGLTQAEAALPPATEARSTARAQAADAARRFADLQAEARGQTDNEIRRAEIAHRIAQANTRLSRVEEKAQRDRSALVQTKARALDQWQADQAAEARQHNVADLQIAQAQATQQRATDVEAAKAAAGPLQAELARAEAAIVQHKAAAENLHALQAEEGKRRALLSGITREGKHLAEHCAGLRTRSGLIEVVPCHGSEMSGTCPLLQDARAARTGLVEADQSVAQKRRDYLEAEQAIQALSKEIAALGAPRQDLAAAEQALRAIRERIRVNDALLALESGVAQADEIIANAQALIREGEQTLAAKRAAIATVVADSDRCMNEISEQQQAEQAECLADLKHLKAELAALPPPADTVALRQAEQAAEQAEAAIAQAEQAVSALNMRIGAARERIGALEAKSAEFGSVRAGAAQIEAEMAHWANLAKAFGNDGIIALAIDDAGPTLSAYTNDLLLSCYGPRFSVSIRTQAETAKGNLKETFDIIVFDGETGDEKSVRDMSGGERIWVNEALTRAIALYQGHMHGRHYECLFADESDGALDPERKQQFMRMKRKVLELGGYRQEIFISHTPELWEMADRVIDLGGFMEKGMNGERTETCQTTCPRAAEEAPTAW